MKKKLVFETYPKKEVGFKKTKKAGKKKRRKKPRADFSKQYSSKREVELD